jgi:hypothetical protein
MQRFGVSAGLAKKYTMKAIATMVRLTVMKNQLSKYHRKHGVGFGGPLPNWGDLDWGFQAGSSILGGLSFAIFLFG